MRRRRWARPFRVKLHQEIKFHEVARALRIQSSNGNIHAQAGVQWTEPEKSAIEDWIKLLKQEPYQIQAYWFPEEHPWFSVLQYQALTEEQLPIKIAQFPRGSRFTYTRTMATTVVARERALIERMKSLSEERGIQLEIADPK